MKHKIFKNLYISILKIKKLFFKFFEKKKFLKIIKFTDYREYQIDPFDSNFKSTSPPSDLSNIVNYIVWQNDLSIKKKIFEKKYDDKSVNLQELASNGFTKLKSDEFKDVNSPIIFNKIKRLFDLKINNDNKKPDQDIYYIENPTIHIEELVSLFEIENINKIVRNYLGEDSYLQYAQLMKIGSQSNSRFGSSAYHHDAVGHRIKVYFNFNGKENINKNSIRPTYYALSSHINSWPNNHQKASRFLDEYVEDNYDIVSLYNQNDEILIFDTNGLHRGHYEKSHDEQDRYSLVFEFATRKKFEDLKKLGNFPIGCKPQLISRKINIKKTLIDTKYLIKKDDTTFNYGEQWWHERQPHFFYN